MAPNYPLINGRRYDFASIDARVNGKSFVAIKEISYDSDLTHGDVYGSATKKIGRTGGVHKPTGSMTLYREEFAEFIGLIQAAAAASGNPGAGIQQVEFQVVVMFQEFPGPLQTDTLVGAVIDKISNSHSQGGDALVVKCDLNLMDLLFNGTPAVGGLR